MDDYEPVIRLHVHYSRAYIFSQEEAEDTGDLDGLRSGNSMLAQPDTRRHRKRAPR